MNQISYNPGIINKIGKRILLFFKSFLKDEHFKNILYYIHKLYKFIQRYKYLILYILSYPFLSDIEKTKRYFVFKLFPYTMGGSKALENAYDLTNHVDNNNIKGCIIECGVAEGGTSAMMALTNRAGEHEDRNFFLFDSFEGLPDPTNNDFIDGNAGDFIRPLEKGDCLGKIEQVEKLFFIDNKFSKEKIKLIQGWFENTVPGFSFAGNIAILRLDGDWYESTRIPLENFYSKISIGGIIIIDDYATCHGSKKAVDEFIEINGFKPNLMPDGRGGAWFIKEA